jgi:hypothetical protein
LKHYLKPRLKKDQAAAKNAVTEKGVKLTGWVWIQQAL